MCQLTTNPTNLVTDVRPIPLRETAPSYRMSAGGFGWSYEIEF